MLFVLLLSLTTTTTITNFCIKIYYIPLWGAEIINKN